MLLGTMIFLSSSLELSERWGPGGFGGRENLLEG